ncbi:MFS transporter [Virgibacillus sp. NKC19-16]|uniref:CynX/NimT family MFS transporter n=1 Tax=Virgibacillus salidurans TaxID=2831673 RepID=UPI001F40FDBF|nr:MFS transporter [Virgibacillus sp. NKC19-16]UJL46386.1 MFS transporter [Virgibacillus sp. NKC19-16]
MEKSVTKIDNPQRNKLALWGLVIGIILIASNLRAPLTSVGSLLSFIRDGLGLSNTLAGLITTLPLLAFAFLSPFAPKIANRIGMERTFFFSLILLTIGLIVRPFFGAVLLFAGTILIGLAIAIGNVLLPSFIKINFPLKIGIMTGLYAVFMNVFGALAAGISVPLASISGIGWQGSLAFWAVLSIIATAIWIPQLRRKNNTDQVGGTPSQNSSSIWKSSLAWHITIFMGLQSLIYNTMLTWLPVILQTQGYSSSTAGWMLSLMQFGLIPTTFIVPLIAEKMANQKLIGALSGILFLIGVIGLIFGNPILNPVAALLIGIASGSAFSLSMMFFSLRSRDGKQTSEMSGMGQSFGYLMAAAGPVTAGALHDVTNGWLVPLIVLCILAVIIVIAGVESGKDRKISA